jgi:lyso-ornithine lipid O-acyltransferase
VIGSGLRIGQRSARTAFTMAAALGGGRMRPPRSAREQARRLAAACDEVCAAHDFRAVVTGELPPAPAVLVCNHLSYIDPIILAPQAPFIPISKGEVASWPLVGPSAAALGVLFVNRRDPMHRAYSLRRAIRVLRSGARILNFPEGTTSDGTRLLPFQRGIFGAALIAGVPIVPVAVRYEANELCWTDDAPFLPHYVRTAARGSTTAFIHFDEPILPRRRDTARGLAEVARRRILGLTGVDPHAPAERLRVPAPRPDALLPAAAG